MEYTHIDESNVDEATERSVQLALQIDELTKERQQLSELLTAFLMSTGVDTYTTQHDRQLKLYPTLSRPLSSLNTFEKKKLYDWAHDKFPEILVVNHAKLQTLLSYGAIAPIPISAKGFSLRVIKEKQNKKVRKIEDLVVIGTEEKEVSMRDTWAEVSEKIKKEKKEPINKQAKHQERLIRLAEMQVMWENGSTFREIARKHDMESGYVRKVLRPYILKKMRELRNAVIKREIPTLKSTISVEIDS